MIATCLVEASDPKQVRLLAQIIADRLRQLRSSLR